ncbi:MAG: hypothetical protein HFH31_00365 [Bacilli bacterium]|nr:hypothetical protein [Bacilli bacterium]
MNDIFKALTEYLKKFSRVYIMTHKNPDLDGLGSAICLYEIASSFEKECYIIDTDDMQNSTVQKMYDVLKDKKIEFNMLKEKEAVSSLNDDTLLVIVDVHKEIMVESSKLLSKSKNVIVIDHHVKGNNYIKTTDLSYINSHLSSVTEFMVYYLKYLNKTVNSIIATIMLTGIEIDTSNYKLKTSEKTFEAASILASMGADSILKQELLKEDKEAYLKRSYFVKNSDMINENMAMCIMDEEIYEPKEIAEVAEQLLQFNNVEASFAIGKLKENIVGVSARSLGNVDVSKIMTELGGGGHLTDAAAQIEATKIEDVKKQLIGIIGGIK